MSSCPGSIPSLSRSSDGMTIRPAASTRTRDEGCDLGVSIGDYENYCVDDRIIMPLRHRDVKYYRRVIPPSRQSPVRLSMVRLKWVMRTITRLMKWASAKVQRNVESMMS